MHGLVDLDLAQTDSIKPAEVEELRSSLGDFFQLLLNSGGINRSLFALIDMVYNIAEHLRFCFGEDALFCGNRSAGLGRAQRKRSVPCHCQVFLQLTEYISFWLRYVGRIRFVEGFLEKTLNLSRSSYISAGYVKTDLANGLINGSQRRQLRRPLREHSSLRKQNLLKVSEQSSGLIQLVDSIARNLWSWRSNRCLFEVCVLLTGLSYHAPNSLQDRKVTLRVTYVPNPSGGSLRRSAQRHHRLIERESGLALTNRRRIAQTVQGFLNWSQYGGVYSARIVRDLLF